MTLQQSMCACIWIADAASTLGQANKQKEGRMFVGASDVGEERKCGQAIAKKRRTQMRAWVLALPSSSERHLKLHLESVGLYFFHAHTRLHFHTACCPSYEGAVHDVDDQALRRRPEHASTVSHGCHEVVISHHLP